MTVPLLTVDRFVTHVSTVHANRGQAVGLHLREKVQAPAPAHQGSTGKPVVLFVHGGFAPTVVAYDLAHGDYSFMAALANAGLDVFAMTHTGYGASPKPMMDDPRNVVPGMQTALVPQVLDRPGAPRYPYKLLTSDSEWNEIDTVVRYIRELRDVDRVSLIGWSIGAPRVGGYAAHHPALVDRLVFLGPAPFSDDDARPAVLPEPGAPTRLQSRDMLMNQRWRADVRGEGQLEDPGICDIVWQELMIQDGLGAQWAADGKGIMRAPTRSQYGWRPSLPNIQAPTLVLLGANDNYAKRRDCWPVLGAKQKVFVKIVDASHFMQFELGRHAVHRLTAEWLLRGTADGHSAGEFQADRDGMVTSLL